MSLSIERWRSLTNVALGSISIALAIFLALVTTNAQEASTSLLDWMPFAIGAIFLCGVAVFYFFVAYCLIYRVAERVTGTFELANIIVGGQVAVANAPISYARKVFNNPEEKTASRNSMMFFVVGRRPWLCLLANFHVLRA